MKTHKGAAKRLRVTGKGKLKRKQCGLRHLNSKHSSKKKRLLGNTSYVNDTHAYQLKRALGI